MSEANPPCPVMPANPLPGFEEGLRQEIAFDLYDAVGTRDRLPPAQTEARNAAAFVMLNSLAPADPLQAMLASQAIALHYAAMACFRRANETETAPDTPAPKLHHTAVRLITAFAATIHRLHTLQEHPLHRETAPADGQPAGKDPMQRDAAPAGQKEFSPAPCGRGTGGGVQTLPNRGAKLETPPDPDPAIPPPNPLPQGEEESDPPLAPKHPVHREPRKPPPPPAPEPYFDWRNKTVLERFAHFFPERLAAYNGDAAAAHAAWAAENEAEWARVRAERANADKPHAT